MCGGEGIGGKRVENFPAPGSRIPAPCRSGVALRALVYRKSVPKYLLMRFGSKRVKSLETSRFSPLQIEEVSEPELTRPEWVRVKPLLSGVCGSDLGTLASESSPYFSPITSPPFVMGHEIVGVVEDFPAVPIGVGSLGEGVSKVYHPLAPGQNHPVTLSVRFRGGVPAGFARRMQEIGAEVDPALQVSVRPLTELYGSLRSGSRLVAWGLSAVTLSVLLLSAAGIYALMSFTVARRTREIGIRVALGAQPRRIFASIFGRVVRQLTLGLLIGSLVSGVLFAITGLGTGRAAALLLTAAAIMLTIGMLAALGPARRGLRIQPVEALRADG